MFIFILFAVLSLFVFFDLLNELESVAGKYTSLIAFLHVLLQARRGSMRSCRSRC